MSTEGLAQDRLVRKEVSLGTIREYEPPQDHIGLSFCPWMEVQSDDVVFNYTKGLTSDMVPARAEDAESELAGKDEFFGTGRAAINDWAVKHHYDASDVTRYREGLILRDSPLADSLPLVSSSMTEDFANKLARDEAQRRRKIDNRIEWMIMESLDKGVLTYDDGKVAFSVDWGRPDTQQDIAPPNTTLWSNAASDPIDDIMQLQEAAEDAAGVDLTRVIISKKIMRNLYKNDKFYVQGTTSAQRLYNESGWGPSAALSWIGAQTGVEFIVYDSVYRSRARGSQTIVNNRFTREDYAIFLPSAASLSDLESDVGFAAMLTSPHPEGNWTPGYYEWEQDTKDPWGLDRGSGIKAFPVMPHLDLTWVVKVL